MRSGRVASIALSATLVLTAWPAEAGKRWKLRFHPKRGAIHRLAMDTDFSVSARLPVLGSMEGTLSLRVEAVQRVARRRWRGPTTMELTAERIRFDAAFGERRQSYDSAQRQARSEPDDDIAATLDRLVGRSIAFEVSRRGEISEVHGLDDLIDEVGGPADEGSPAGPLPFDVSPALVAEVVRAILQQATPVFPGGRLREGDVWTGRLELPNLALGSMRVDSTHRLEGLDRRSGRECLRIGLADGVVVEGQGQAIWLGRLAETVGIRGEIRLTTDEGTGSGEVWTERRGGLTVALERTLSVEASLSVPVRILGFERRTRVPVIIRQQTRLERMAPIP